jgi:phage gpG-like protein
MSVRVKVDLKGLDRVEGIIKRANYDLLGRVGRRVVEQGQDNAPYKTGALRADIQIRRRTSRKLVVGTKRVIYAPIHEFGGKTKPHIIRAKRKKALYWKGADHPVKWVDHPGSRIKAKRYMRRAAETVQREVDRIAREVYKKHGL